MNELASLGLILLFALFAGHLVKFLRVPEVTGYIGVGILVGPYVFGWLSHENLQTLAVFSEVALGLILFSIGGVFEFSRIRSSGKAIAWVTAVESLLAAVLVGGGMVLAGQPWPVALLLGAIAVETAAASTLMVMREGNCHGPLTDTLTGVIGINNVLCLLAFSLVASGLDLQKSTVAVGGLHAVYVAVYPLVWQIVGSLALGFLVGVLLAMWAARVVEKGETLILLCGCVLLCVGVARVLSLSPLIASLAVGATMVNLSTESRRLFNALGETDPPLYAIFFVIAGADLNVKLLGSLGLLGGIYVGGRMLAKLVGPWAAARSTNLPQTVRTRLGMAMLSQAGLAIGLTLSISERFPELAPVVNTVVLASVVVFEIIGPLAAKFALARSGEIHNQPPLTDAAF
ncbi:MAG TPA: cation:proton antiporter [Bryobacteraceae bacterium]|nr:cation:proton antiporter [Bryobacteraceae bacterium]